MISAPTLPANCNASFELACWDCAFECDLATTLARRSRDHAACEVARQEMCLAVLDTRPPDEVIEDDDRLFAWLLDVARKRLIDHMQREKRHRHEPLLDNIADSSDTEREEAACQVHAALATMSAGKDRDAARLLELHFIEGRSIADIAHELGISPNAASARLYRAKQKFQIAWTGGGVTIEWAEYFLRILASYFGVSCDYSVTETSPGGSP